MLERNLGEGNYPISDWIISEFILQCLLISVLMTSVLLLLVVHSFLVRISCIALAFLGQILEYFYEVFTRGTVNEIFI